MGSLHSRHLAHRGSTNTYPLCSAARREHPCATVERVGRLRAMARRSVRAVESVSTDSYPSRLTGYFLKILATPLLIGLETIAASAFKSALGARCNASVIVPRKTTRLLLRSNRSITSVPVVTSHMFIVALPTIPLYAGLTTW